MKTATPPKGVTARWVSRRITRSPESRAVISCGTSLSEVFASTPLYRKHLRAMYSSASEFRLSRDGGPQSAGRQRATVQCAAGGGPSGSALPAGAETIPGSTGTERTASAGIGSAISRIAATPRGGGRATGGNSGLGGGLGTADHRRDRSRGGEVSVGRGSEFLGGDLPGAGRVGGEIRERGISQREPVDAQHIGSGGQCGGEGEGHRL